jgi:23S rRNA (uridine2552-2'-O)-methyltransferase
MPKQYNYKDPLMFKAHREGFRARSVYKLEELDEKFGLFFPNMKVLDVGAAPGSWLQYVSPLIRPKGKALGLDLKEIKPIGNNVVTKIADIMDVEAIKSFITELKWNKVDIIISDIAPNTTGIAYVDQKKSVELSLSIFELAKQFLRPRGRLVMKVFPGEDFSQFMKTLKGYFKHVSVQKVSASRDRSREVYVVCW